MMLESRSFIFFHRLVVSFHHHLYFVDKKKESIMLSWKFHFATIFKNRFNFCHFVPENGMPTNGVIKSLWTQSKEINKGKRVSYSSTYPRIWIHNKTKRIMAVFDLVRKRYPSHWDVNRRVLATIVFLCDEKWRQFS